MDDCASIIQLPRDMIMEIALYLIPDEYIRMRNTCRTLYRILSSVSALALYRKTHTRVITFYDAGVVGIIDTTFWNYKHELNSGMADEYGHRYWTSECWYKNGVLHRDIDQPAVIHYANGIATDKEWYRNGELHRENDQPAVEYECHDYNMRQTKASFTIRLWDMNKDINGLKAWIVNGKIHRENDKPAIELFNKDRTMFDREWYYDGKLHRDGDKPACIYACGDKSWYCHGVRHRGGGKPAFISLNGGIGNGTMVWRTDGKNIDKLADYTMTAHEAFYDHP